MFIDDLTQDVFHLTKNYRTKDDPELARILAKLRIADLDDAGGDRLMDQMIEPHESRVQDFLHNHEKTIHLYTQRYEKT